MDLSIIIVSYNTKELLKRCLESVARCLVLGDSKKGGKVTITQPLAPNTEIIVVDNGSTDGSAEEVKKFIKSIKSERIKILLIENKENLGFSKAVNQSLHLANGKVILLLNSDTQIKKGSLKKVLEFEEKVSPAIIGLKMLDPDGSIQGSVFNLPTIKRAIEEFWLGKKGSFSKFAPTADKPIEVEAVSGGAMAISSEIVQKIGLFDERYFMYFEDLDYCRKAGKVGFRVYYLPSAEVIHEHGESGRTLADSQNQWRRLIPSSKIYHGSVSHYLLNFILWTSQKFRKVRI